MHEHVGDLQISVNDVLLCEVMQSLEDVLDDGFSPILIKVLLFPQPGLKIALIAQLSDDIAVPIAGEHLVALEYISMIQLLQHVNLRKK